MSNFLRVLISLSGAVALWATSAVASPGYPRPVVWDDSAASPTDEATTLPLQPERTVAFTTTEGTWISLDVSPDGRTIVFDLLGDLYTLSMEGGRATRLTQGPAYDAQPRYSPDGRQIVFVSDRAGSEDVWVMNADGSAPHAVTQDRYSRFISPSFTPDGQSILVSRSAPQTYGRSVELWLYHRAGGKGVAVVQTESTPGTPREAWNNALGAVASPDGRYFYYAYARGNRINYAVDAGAFRQMPYWQVRRRDRMTGEEMTLTAARGSGMRPVLSPDGRWLAYGTRHHAATDLWLRELSSGEERRLIAGVQRDDQESSSAGRLDLMPGYAFTPDGKSVVAAYGGKIHRISVAHGTAQVIPMEVPVSQALGPVIDMQGRVPDGPVTARIVQRPALSPDGKRLAFTAFGQLHVQPWPQGVPRQLTRGVAGGQQPAWSPDGRWLAYVSWSGTGGGALWKLRADGAGAPVRLTQDEAYYRDPVWSADGAGLVVLRMSKHDFLSRQADLEMGGAERGGHAHGHDTAHANAGAAASTGPDVAWIDADGGRMRIVARADGLTRPHFGPDRSRIFFSGGNQLASMRLDGSDRRVHLRLTGIAVGNESTRDEKSTTLLSPDGRHVLARYRNRAYVLPMTWTGLETPLVVDTKAPAVPLRALERLGADDVAWTPDGRQATWVLGNTLFRAAVQEDGGFPAVALQPAESVESTALVVQRPRARPRGALLLSGARVVSMRGGEVIEEADLLVVDNRVADLGVRGTLQVPSDAQRIDMAGMTIVPGFVDLHPHMMQLRRGVLDAQAWPMANYLAYGVTTGRDPQSQTVDAFVYEDLVETGDIVGPRSFSTGYGIYSTQDFASYADALDMAKRYKDFYRVGTVKSYLVGNRRQQQWMVAAARQVGLMATTEGGSDFRISLTHVLDGFSGNEHVLPYAPLYDDVVQLFARSGTVYTPAVLMTYGGPFVMGFAPYWQQSALYRDEKVQRFYPPGMLERRKYTSYWNPPEESYTQPLAESAAAIAKAGGRVCMGSHGDFSGLGYHWNLWALADGGLSPHETLQAATTCGARALGYARDLGSLEPGKLADLLVLSENPLEDIRHTVAIRYVMKNGTLYDGNTLDELWPVAKQAGALWWHGGVTTVD